MKTIEIYNREYEIIFHSKEIEDLKTILTILAQNKEETSYVVCGGKAIFIEKRKIAHLNKISIWFSDNINRLFYKSNFNLIVPSNIRHMSISSSINIDSYVMSLEEFKNCLNNCNTEDNLLQIKKTRFNPKETILNNETLLEQTEKFLNDIAKYNPTKISFLTKINNKLYVSINKESSYKIFVSYPFDMDMSLRQIILLNGLLKSNIKDILTITTENIFFNSGNISIKSFYNISINRSLCILKGFKINKSIFNDYDDDYYLMIVKDTIGLYKNEAGDLIKEFSILKPKDYPYDLCKITMLNILNNQINPVDPLNIPSCSILKLQDFISYFKDDSDIYFFINYNNSIIIPINGLDELIVTFF